MTFEFNLPLVMNQYIDLNQLPNDLHSSSTDTLLELQAGPRRIPSTDILTSSQQSSSLIDLCAFNSLYQRLVDTSSSSLDKSSHKLFIPASELYVPISPIHHQTSSNEMLVSSSNSVEATYHKFNQTNPMKTSSDSIALPAHTTNDNHSNSSISFSNAKVQHSPTNSCISKASPKLISCKRHDFSTFHENDNNNTLDYELSSFISKVEQMPNLWSMDSTNISLIKDNVDSTKSFQVLKKSIRTSPILRRSLTSSSKSNETRLFCDIRSTRKDVIETDIAKINENRNRKSPQYRPRHSYCQSSETKLTPSNHTNSLSENNLNKSSTLSRQSCRSPVLIRRPQQKLPTINLNSVSLSVQPMALLSLDTNGSILSINDDLNNPSSTELQVTVPSSSKTLINNNNKRPLESSTSEQILIKRRYQKPVPAITVQRHTCVSYPINIQRCVDCQTVNSSDSSMHLTGCRFQHCRTLKYLGDDKYEIDGFTTADKAKLEDIEYLIVPNSGGQPPMNLMHANYIFIQIARFFCLLVSYEEAERSTQNEKQIIWKRYIPGWREVCDECSTTLFNYHYMCKKCGYMVCVECANEFSQMNTEKRKKIKRTCNHVNSYCLSEFIPWNILTNLRSYCLDYLSKLNINSSIKLCHLSRNENLSIFIKSLKMKRSSDKDIVQKTWSSVDCGYDPNIEFYCHGRLPVFNEWTSENAKSFFQRVWAASCPVLVRRVHHNLSKTLWHPSSFKEHMIDHCETPALWDCETLTPLRTNETILTRFWDGFERLNIRLKDQEHGGRTRILKLKDWPTKKDFASVFPTRLHDLMNNIPFGDYTRRSYTYNDVTYHGGVFNIVERLPACLVKPDLGPKLYIAYSQLTSQASKKAGTTNLHIDVSDAVNVLVYVGIGGHGDDGSDKDEEIQQVEAEILDSNIDDAQLQRLRNGERPGALWHLFRADDVKKIREYIGRTQRKVSGSDYIHDQTTYLEKEDLEELRESSQVEAYPILQFLGDAVFIPSGAPHQVKNLHSCIKIAEDFVSPENLDRCLITTNEFRSLSKTHTNHADILQAKNILYYATRDALDSLNESNEIFSQSSTSSILD